MYLMIIICFKAGRHKTMSSGLKATQNQFVGYLHFKITILRVPPIVPPEVATQLLSGGTAIQVSQRYCAGTL